MPDIEAVIQIVKVSMCSAAVLFNAFILAAIVRSHASLKGYRYFLINLSVANLCSSLVGIVQDGVVLAVTSPIGPYLANFELCLVLLHRAFHITFHISYLTTLCAMSVDQLIGILRPMMYQKVMKTRNICITILFIWLFASIFAFSDHLLAAVGSKLPETLCPVDQNLLERPKPKKQEGQKTAVLPTVNPTFESSFADLLEADINNPKLPSPPKQVGKKTAVLPTLDPTFESTFADLIEADINTFSPQSVNASDERYSKMFEDASGGELTGELRCPPLGLNGQSQWLVVSNLFATGICFVFLIICNGVIYATVRFKMVINTGSHLRLAVTTILLLGAFGLLMLPALCHEAKSIVVMLVIDGCKQSKKDFDASDTSTLIDYFIIQQVVYTLTFVHPLVDPLIYSFRFSAVRKESIALVTPRFAYRFINRAPRGSRKSAETIPLQHGMLSNRPSANISSTQL